MERVGLYEDGQRQLARLPESCRLPGSGAYVKKVGNVVMLIPVEESWQTLTDSLELFTDDFMAEREQPESQDREQINS